MIKTKVVFFEEPAIANQSNLKLFKKLYWLKKAGPPKKPHLF